MSKKTITINGTKWSRTGSATSYVWRMWEKRNDTYVVLSATQSETAFLDRIAELEESIKNHRSCLWGDEPVCHQEDRELYGVLSTEETNE